MTLPSTPMTELEAVNLMLSVIGEAPVNSLDNSGLADANLAHQILGHASREVQLVGWHWNTEEDFPLLPNQSQEILLPSNTLKVDTTGTSQGSDLVQRGRRLYDRVSHSYEFSAPVKVRIVLNLAFEELPETARYLITIRSARQFQTRVLGADASTSYTAKDELDAMSSLRQEEADVGDFNMLRGSWSVSSILAR
jgi:hypothetical protein